MGLGVLMNLEGVDIFAFCVSGVLGYLAGLLLPDGAWAIYGSILISYHLFLVWLLITADHETGFSLPIGSTVVTHLAFLTIVVSFGFGRHYIPLFGFLRFGIAGLAIFERGWLFSGHTTKKKVPADAPVITDTAEDYQAWLVHLAQRKPAQNKPGTSLRAEYQEWLMARAKARAAASASDRTA
jgi:hypothetical protein